MLSCISDLINEYFHERAKVANKGQAKNTGFTVLNSTSQHCTLSTAQITVLTLANSSLNAQFIIRFSSCCRPRLEGIDDYGGKSRDLRQYLGGRSTG